ncbi:MAG: ABC transporter permease [Candidatus Bathyarchaeota archaeon]|jgi:putative ABC transport system permease protein|nr:ABC transporter permease [Candidatus Bathyarchaeota archaeon]
MSLESLKERKFRFALNLIGILIGCTAVTGLVSITQGLSNNINTQLEVFGPQNIMVIPGQIQQGRGIVGSTLNWRDLELISKVEDVNVATPIIANKIVSFSVRGRSFMVEMFGVTSKYFEINKANEVDDGRQLLRTDTSAVVIGANIADPLDEDEPILGVGDRLKVKAKVNGNEKELALRVVGIYGRTGGSFGADLDNSIAIPLRTAQQFWEIGGEFDYFIVQAETLEVISDVVERIEDKLGEAVTVISFESAQELVGEVMGTIEAVLGGIAAISLIVAGVGIINTMTVSVMERTREIGVLKAVGAKSRDVLLMFISEAVVTGIFGGVTGSLLGVLLAQVIGGYINMPPDPSLGLVVFVVGYAVATSVISGLYPAWRASNLHPVEALRYE